MNREELYEMMDEKLDMPMFMKKEMVGDIRTICLI